MSYITEILPQLLDGLKLTVLVFILTLILSIPLGMVLAFLLRIPIVKWFVNLYVWIMRGTPLDQAAIARIAESLNGRGLSPASAQRNRT